MGIGIIFEKENINTLETDTELIITFMSAFAQSESESISANVRWGKRQAMKEGKASVNFKKIYGFYLDDEGNPQVNSDQAEAVRSIYDQYLQGASLRMIKLSLEGKAVPNPTGGAKWDISQIRSILGNEKYCGDVLMQKTFTQDCINKKVIKNTGQLPMYLIQNNHPAIVSREIYQAVQAEKTRRSASASPSKKTSSTGRSCYASKFALSERLVCGECGTLYRRCTWKRNGKTRIIWRCVSRLDYGHQPLVYENHGIDARYTGPHRVAPTMSARYGTGGNNVPLVEQDTSVYCIVGNAIDRQPQNGGNGIGYQKDIAYTLTATDHHAVFSRQRVDVFTENEVVSTESARQHKDATDLVAQPYQDAVGTLVRSDHKGISSQYVSDDKCIVENHNLIRRLTPLECERLQGFPDGWTNNPRGIRFRPLQSLGQQCGDSMRRVRYAGNCNCPTSWAQEAGEIQSCAFRIMIVIPEQLYSG